MHAVTPGLPLVWRCVRPQAAGSTADPGWQWSPGRSPLVICVLGPDDKGGTVEAGMADRSDESATEAAGDLAPPLATGRRGPSSRAQVKAGWPDSSPSVEPGSVRLVHDRTQNGPIWVACIGLDGAAAAAPNGGYARPLYWKRCHVQ